MEGKAMKINYLCLLASVLAACSPLNPDVTEIPSDGLVQMTFKGRAEGGQTKTSLDSDYSIRWSTSDAVTIFASTGTAGSTFNVSGTEENGKVATFSGLSHSTSNGYYYAVYPASGDARLVSTSGTVLSSLPTTQTGVKDSYDPDACLSVARVDADTPDANDILHFKNAVALLYFTVPGAYLNRVKIESRDGSVAMTGPANINYNDGQPTVSPTTASKNYVEVTFPQGTKGNRYYAVVYPGNYSQGFILTFYNSANNYNRYYSTKALDLGRNAVIKLAEKDWTVIDDRPQNESGTELIAPTISSGGQASASSASITFTCSSGKRDTYKYYLRDAGSMGTGTQVGSLQTGSGQYGSYTYTFTGLTTGHSYDLGVSAACVGESGYGDSPITWLEDVTINAATSNMKVTVESSATNYYNFIA